MRRWRDQDGGARATVDVVWALAFLTLIAVLVVLVPGD